MRDTFISSFDILKMRACIQRVTRASVTVDQQIVGKIRSGMLVLLGVEQGDSQSDVDYMAAKICGLRIFDDDEGKMNRSLSDTNGSMLVVSQFTLLGDCRKGRRPGFGDAADLETGRLRYEQFVDKVVAEGIETATGVFRAQMQVELVNDGPVTLLIDSRKRF